MKSTIRLLVLLCIANTVSQAQPSFEQLKQEITQFVKATETKSISDFQLSPDKKTIAYTVREPLADNKSKTNIWLYTIATAATYRYTTSAKADTHPQWAPDGKTLAFLSDRGDKTQIYQVAMTGGEAKQFTESKTSIETFEWSSQGDYIAFTSPDPKTNAEEEAKKNKDDAVVEDFTGEKSRLRIISLKDKVITTLVGNEWNIEQFQWIPGEQALIVSANTNPYPEMARNKLYLIDITTKTMKEIASPATPYGEFRISPEGKTIAYHGTREDGPVAFDLYTMPITGGKSTNLTAKSIDRSIDGFLWIDNGSLLVEAETGTTSTYYQIDMKGSVKKKSQFDLSGSGTLAFDSKMLVFVGHTFTSAPEIYTSADFATAKKVSTFNASQDTLGFIAPEVVRYKSFDKQEIEAVVYKPKNFTQGKKYAAVVYVHGGPTGRFANRFNTWPELLAQRGYVVVCPNIRGSSGYSFDFLASNKGDWGGADYKDVLAAADYIINEGWADPEKIGIGGWSYGGYMSAWAVTQTTRFKASVSGAPMIDLAVEYGAETSSINPYDTWFLGTPYENHEDFIRMSPITFVKNVKTPTLLLCGENDVIDPIEQCSQFYRGLKRYGVDTRFVRYPREGHGIREEAHRNDVLMRMLDWFGTYLN